MWRAGRGRRREEEWEEKITKTIISARAMLGLQAKDTFTHNSDQSLLIKNI